MEKVIRQIKPTAKETNILSNNFNNATPMTLSQLIDQLMISLSPQAIEKKSLIVNDVEHDMFIHTDKNILSSILSDLLTITIKHTENNCIHVSAKFYGNIILTHVKTNDKSKDSAFAQSLRQIQPLAEKLGGCIIVTNNKIKGTTLAFTFNNNQILVA
jgi:signal transduction histidine kinase